MKVHFNYPRTIDNRHFIPGVHELPDAMADHWFLKALVASSDVKIIQQEAIKSSDTPQESKEADLDVSEPKPEKPKRSKRS